MPAAGFEPEERAFGGLAADSELSYAVQQFFANGGSNAYVVRVPQHGSSPAKVTQVRLPPELAEALGRRATREHTRPSEIIRQALRAYLKSS